MISVNEALQLVRENAMALTPLTIPLRNAGGLVLAEDLTAGISLPNFNQSAMDGYAFRFAELLEAKSLTVVGEVAAGDEQSFVPEPYSAVRIFTGAAVPQGLDTVVMQEKTERKGEKLLVLDDQLQKGSNVRKKGDEIREGELALAKGTVLSPAAVGYLAGLGITQVTVHPKPAVHIIVTGKELQKAGNPLLYGQVYESNAAMLQAALEQLHISNSRAVLAGDDLSEIKEAILAGLETADMILLSGGVSVGNYDFVVQAAEACGITQLFHKVAQRPGKPLYVGKKGRKLIFGLPGNPASVLSCFYNFVVVAIEGLTGSNKLLERRHLPLLTGFTKKIELTQFLKAYYTNEGVTPLSAQESFRLSSFSVANCLLVLPAEKREFTTGEMVEILVLPYL
jgi:molybdopterin molybdotransferase